MAGSGTGGTAFFLSRKPERAGGEIPGVYSSVSSRLASGHAFQSERTKSPRCGVGLVSLSPVSQMSATTLLNSEVSGGVGPAVVHLKAVEADLPISVSSDLSVVMTSSESAPVRYPPGDEGYEATLDSSSHPAGDSDLNFTGCSAFSVSDEAAKLLFNGTANSVVAGATSSCEATSSLLPAVISDGVPGDEKTGVSNESFLANPASAHTLLSFSSALLGARNSERDVAMPPVSPDIGASGLHQLTQEEAAAAVAAMAGATGESSEAVLAKLAAILPFSSASETTTSSAAAQGLASPGEVLAGLGHQDGTGVGHGGPNTVALLAGGAGTSQAEAGAAAPGQDASQVRVKADPSRGEASEPLKSNATAATVVSDLLLENLVKAESAEGDASVSVVATLKPGGLADPAALACSAKKAADVAKGRLLSGGGVVDTCGVSGGSMMNTAQAASSSFDVFQHCGKLAFRLEW